MTNCVSSRPVLTMRLRFHWFLTNLCLLILQHPGRACVHSLSVYMVKKTVFLVCKGIKSYKTKEFLKYQWKNLLIFVYRRVFKYHHFEWPHGKSRIKLLNERDQVKLFILNLCLEFSIRFILIRERGLLSQVTHLSVVCGKTAWWLVMVLVLQFPYAVLDLW